MLYFDVANKIAWTSQPPDYDYDTHESFVPTRTNLKSGFLVWFDFTSYDSAGPNEGINYHIVDLYETYEAATKMAKLIREYNDAAHSSYGYKGRHAQDIEKDFFYAQTSDRTPYIPLGWGTDLKRIYVDEIQVADVTEEMKRQRVF